MATEPITFAEAFHTYLAVRDVREAVITSLERSSSVDRLVSDDRLDPSGEVT